MFISIEGIEGTGKSTVANSLAKLLVAENIKVVQTREPGGTAVAENIRQILLQKYDSENVLAEVELMLMFAARLQHVEFKIKPALENNNWVICDRFVDASYAYQGGGRAIPEAKIKAIQEWSIKEFMPNKTILLDLEPELAFERVSTRNNARDRIESEAMEFFHRARTSYLELAQQMPERFFVVDASNNEQQVINTVWNEVKSWI